MSTARENVYQAMRKEELGGFMYHFMHCVTEVDAGIFSDTGSLESKSSGAIVASYLITHSSYSAYHSSGLLG